MSGLAVLAGVVLLTGAQSATPAPPPDPGSLVRTTVQSEVGVVLDELPPSMRARVTADLLQKPDAFWKARARTQLRLTTYRLVFRSAFYAKDRQALPLPPEDVWEITLDGKPQRHNVNGHDVVGVDYRFSSVLLSDAASPGESEPRLATVGGKWSEPFVFPVDPELVMQRTGYSCMDEAEFPFNSVDSEEVDSFYDQTAVVEKSLGPHQYHNTLQPTQSCVQALGDHVGKVTTAVVYERLAWDPVLADHYRFGEVTGDEPDLEIYLPDFVPSRTSYRYVHAAGSGG